jgi:ABC-2 type transport system ATP-binding protein
LEILGRLSQTDVSRKRIMEVLELVGLEKRFKSKVKTYSHGMKQRLGLAQALIHNPDLIILDEPTTGLDPQGMKEVRDLILFLSNQNKKTIFISSHILYEIELVANRMIIIDKGSAIVEGNVSELLNANNLKVTFEVNDSEKAKIILNNTSWINKIESCSNNKFVFSLTNDEIPKLNSFLIENNIDVSAVIPARSLEQYFLNITEKGA